MLKTIGIAIAAYFKDDDMKVTRWKTRRGGKAMREKRVLESDGSSEM